MNERNDVENLLIEGLRLIYNAASLGNIKEIFQFPRSRVLSAA